MFIWLRTRQVPLISRRPKAVGPVLLVARSPSARLALAMPLVEPKLIIPPVLWSPSLAPTFRVKVPRAYQPGMALERPRPPKTPGVWAGKARPRGFDSE